MDETAARYGVVFFLMRPPPPRSTLFPYTTLFRSSRWCCCSSSGRSHCGAPRGRTARRGRSEEHTSELQSQFHLVCRLLLEKKKRNSGVFRCSQGLKMLIGVAFRPYVEMRGQPCRI